MAAFLLGQPLPVMAQHMTLPGKASVDPNGGAGYTIPVSVPPGTAGMAPALSFQYNSQSGNGLLGMGWSLTGLAAVSRCPRTLAQDGVMGAVNFDANDRFCLDGQRLFAINNGTYGADGTEYRTEIESFTRVISHGTAGTGPAWFEVHTKSGQIMEFGNTADSQVLAQGKTTARSWAVDKVSDTKGNYFTVTYTQDTANGQAYPARIDYTGNAGASLQPYNSVQFAYATRADVTALYNAGSLLETTQRLTDVKTYAGANLVADYQLAYSTTITNPSVLTSITVCAGDGSCLPPTSFTVTDSTATAISAPGTTFSPNSNCGVPLTANCTPLTGDFNGDGRTDLAYTYSTGATIYLSNGDGTFSTSSFTWPSNQPLSDPPSLYFTPLVGDFNADGKTDFAFASDGTFYVYLSNGDGTFAGNTFDYPSELYTTLTSLNTSLPPTKAVAVLTGDFNGDGKTDITFTGATSGATFLSNGDGTFAVVQFALGQNFGIPPQANYTPVSGDFDGDGKTDFALTAQTGLYVYRSNGDGTFSASVFTYPAAFQSPNGGPWQCGVPETQYCSAPFSGDFNGDGKTDVAVTGGNALYVLISKGDGTFLMAGFGLSTFYGNPPDAVWTPVVGDFNGDGKTDFAFMGATAVDAYFGNGDGTFSMVEQGYPNGWNFGTPPTTSYSPMTGDFNGDGTMDLGLANAATLYMLQAISAPPNFLLNTVTSGLGATTKFTYQPLTNSSVYTKGGGSFPPGLPNPLVYPYADVQAPMYVVSRVDNSNGIGGTLSAAYAYAGARTDNSGRGFLGYRQVTATDLQTNVVKTTTYGQGYPYVGLVASETQALNGATLNTTTNTYASTSLGGTRYQVFLTQSQASSTDLDGSALPTVTTSYQYDNFGNATQVVASASDGYSKTTDNNYTNDTTNWLLGRLISASVTAVAPTPPTPPPPVQALPADMTVALVHAGSFQTGQVGAVYTITVANAGTGPSAGVVNVVDTLPPGLTATAMAGTGWACTLATLTCTRSDALAPGSSYPPVTLTVNVAATTSPSVTNIATVSGGGETNSGNDTANDPTTITQVVNVTIASSSNNFNLWNYLSANGLQSTGPMTVSVTIQPGVQIGSASTGTPAFDTGSFPSGSTVSLTNNGTIVGAGGQGGAASTAPCNQLAGGPGGAGGSALRVQLPVSIVNNGSIWGGGGGGGSGQFGNFAGYVDLYGSALLVTSAVFGGGGGGGAGAVAGSGGAGGNLEGSYPGLQQVAQPGGAGTTSTGGAGGAGDSVSQEYTLSLPNLTYGGSGGSGGGPGQPGAGGGSAGSAAGWGPYLPPGAACAGFSPGAGGAAGAYVVGNSLITWTLLGDVRGPAS